MSESLRESLPGGLGVPASAQPRDRYEPIHPDSGRGGRLRARLTSALAALGVLLAKLKSLLLLLPEAEAPDDLRHHGRLDCRLRARLRRPRELAALEGTGNPRWSRLLLDPARTRALVGAVYVGLAGLLAVGVAETFFSRSV